MQRTRNWKTLSLSLSHRPSPALLPRGPKHFSPQAAEWIDRPQQRRIVENSKPENPLPISLSLSHTLPCPPPPGPQTFFPPGRGVDWQVPADHPPRLYAGRHRRRHRLQHGRVPGDCQGRAGRVHDQPGAAVEGLTRELLWQPHLETSRGAVLSAAMTNQAGGQPVLCSLDRAHSTECVGKSRSPGPWPEWALLAPVSLLPAQPTPLFNTRPPSAAHPYKRPPPPHPHDHHPFLPPPRRCWWSRACWGGRSLSWR